MRKVLTIPGVDGTSIEVPYFEFGSHNSGPHLTVLAGIHGAEYCSILAARKFITELDESDLIGKLTVVPIVNVLAFWARSPFVIPVDGQNLNRAFPGNSQGSFTERYAFHIFEKFIRNSDYLVDMHAGDIPESLEPFTIFEESEVENISLKMSKSYLLPHIVRQKISSLVVAGSTSTSTAAIGIPAIIAESGQNGIVEPEAVALHLRGIRNLATSLGIIKGTPITHNDETFHLYDGWNWLRAEKAGWWSPAFSTGSTVEKGDVLGTLSDPWGETILEIMAPQRGTVLFQTSSPAVSENGILVGLALRK